MQEMLPNRAPPKVEATPNPKCSKCYGRGYTGIEVTSQRKVWCKCVVKQVRAQVPPGHKMVEVVLCPTKPSVPVVETPPAS